MIMYEDFLDAIEYALSSEGRMGGLTSDNNIRTGHTLKLGYVNGSGYDGLRVSHNTNENWGDDMDSINANESLNQQRFRRSGGVGNRSWEPPIELEEGSDSMYYGQQRSLSPPKPAGRSSLDFASARYMYDLYFVLGSRMLLCAFVRSCH